MIYQVRLPDGKVVWMTERALQDHGDKDASVLLAIRDLFSFNMEYGGIHGTD